MIRPSFYYLLIFVFAMFVAGFVMSHTSAKGQAPGDCCPGGECCPDGECCQAKEAVTRNHPPAQLLYVPHIQYQPYRHIGTVDKRYPTPLRNMLFGDRYDYYAPATSPPASSPITTPAIVLPGSHLYRQPHVQ